VDELKDKIKNFNYSFSPQEYRQYALTYFSYRQMSEGYLQKYELVLQGKSFGSKNFASE
jgi:hypothetical protein